MAILCRGVSSVLTRSLGAGNAVRACGHPGRELEERDGRPGRRQIGFVAADVHVRIFPLAAARVVGHSENIY